MRRSLSACLFVTVFFITPQFCAAQKISSNLKRDTSGIGRKYNQFQTAAPSDESKDSSIKAKLIELAVNNPQIDIANAQIKIAEFGLAKAKSSWLSSLSVNSNVNEFVVNNTTVNGVSLASNYPKYNFGLSVPFDIFSRTKQDKNVANQNIVAAKALREDKIRTVKTIVLSLYENYKEKKELLRLQKISAEGDNDSYVNSQKSYADGSIQLEEMNRAYQLSIDAQSKLVISQRDFNVSKIELEQVIGGSLDDAIKDATALKPNDN